MSGRQEGGKLDSAAMKTKVRERRDSVTLRLFKSKLNEIHLDSQTSQVITGGESFFFFFFPGIGFWLGAVKHENLWVRIIFSCVKKAADGGSAGEARPVQFIMIFSFTSLRFFWTDFLCLRQGRETSTMTGHTLLPSRNILSSWQKRSVDPNWWSLRTEVFFPYHQVTTQIHSTEIKTLCPLSSK